ncbi:MAG: UDP-3-O-(3-hydroxymyristoyl)glucosamine N-acyltransferase [Gemmataceae bacterium]|nr:UDP-3-O-(3-hydroxymyristoyl)glucosamine N-acyltransferase [Gemmataceae bacterium]
MSVTLRQLAELVQGTVQGDGDLPISGARPLGEAEPGDITFVEDARNAIQLHRSRASAAVVPSSVQPNGLPLIQVADPLTAFVQVVRHLHGRPEPPPRGIDPRASVHPSAVIGAEPSIHPFAVIEEGTVIGARCRIHAGVVIGRFCRLGDDVTLYPNAVLYDGTVLGDRVTVHASAVLGADGFGYRFHDGRHAKVPQLGHVEVGDDVEIGAGTTIDRATFGVTRIGLGSKIDNQVQVGHNCKVGRHNLLVSQVGIAGSSSTGDYVVLAGQVGVVGHVHIGDGAVVGAQSGVHRDVPAGQRMLGSPILPESEQKRVWVSMGRIPQMYRDVERIKKQLGLTGDA